MTAEALIFTLSALGISETVYLIKKRVRSEEPICPIGEGCVKVLTSKYHRLFIVPNDILGLLFYIGSSLIAALIVIGIGPIFLLESILIIIVAAGSLFAVFLVYLQAKVIRTWCFWCLMSSCTVWLMGVILVVKST